MCGIVGYIGPREAGDLLVSGLRRLEYRGYDSAGVAVVNGALDVRKKEGKVDELAKLLDARPVSGTVGVGHTRWATHGPPNDVNAHPHEASDGSFAIIHNGIIENYGAIKKRLIEKGYTFESETDTEVLAHFIEDVQNEADLSFPEAVRQALTQVDGAYGIVGISRDDPDMLVVARNGSPLLLGIGDGEYFIGSDASPFIEYTRNVVYLSDGEMAVVRRDGYEVFQIDGAPVSKEVHALEWDLEEIEKGGYEHFMLKEIMEQPHSVADAMRGRVHPQEGQIRLGGLQKVLPQLVEAERIVICACGTSWHAGLAGEYLIEALARVPVEVEYASEFRYRNPVLTERDVVIVISQSGETADTLAAVRQAQGAGCLAVGLVNAVGSTIARETDAGVYLHAGPEIGVASTKAFTAQVAVLAQIALLLGAERGVLSQDEVRRHAEALAAIPAQIQTVLDGEEQIRQMARDYRYASNFLYLGRGANFPVALEGALKLKEISYIHAEGYPAAEMKHGPIALIDQFMPVVFIATRDATYEKVVSNIEEVAARGGTVIAITDEGNRDLDALAEYVVEVPKTIDALEPLLTVIPLQLLSYHIAVMRGADVDQPRNLAKSVTVE
ncbi:glutamine--fructose-6-phosphate transaminase (isomerizing) [Rubrivirga sp. S365]|uniref:glutamine--fructose-6-phosphate transaminase (isomerizing) n=1 Tax=Rubrivirga sp. S365 TaxID=3076080 RepID=UPI0028C90430|nr:glutamine--fructose-6-phosphate transaminase (isomerizing) [Rubrivirga sp. S365]MDT7856800.1 glutamine--fructose-6-phosphate transaminase (isomerizing) [Rubrivirga sp. S365]